LVVAGAGGSGGSDVGGSGAAASSPVAAGAKSAAQTPQLRGYDQFWCCHCCSLLIQRELFGLRHSWQGRYFSEPTLCVADSEHLPQTSAIAARPDGGGMANSGSLPCRDCGPNETSAARGGDSEGRSIGRSGHLDTLSDDGHFSIASPCRDPVLAARRRSIHEVRRANGRTPTEASLSVQYKGASPSG